MSQNNGSFGLHAKPAGRDPEQQRMFYYSTPKTLQRHISEAEVLGLVLKIWPLNQRFYGESSIMAIDFGAK